jgi:hypothetical protein
VAIRVFTEFFMVVFLSSARTGRARVLLSLGAAVGDPSSRWVRGAPDLQDSVSYVSILSSKYLDKI